MDINGSRGMKGYKFFSVLFVFSLLCLIQGCSDDDALPALDIRTSVVSAITETSAMAGGKINGVLSGVSEVGIAWFTEPEAGNETMKYVASATPDNEFTVQINDLRSGTLYFIRAYAKIGEEYTWGDLRNFTTDGQLAMTLPFQERFRGETFPPLHWNIIDKDGDGYNWEAYDNRFFAALSDSYRSKTDLTPENYLVSPKITIAGPKPVLNWSVGAMDAEYYMEHYKVVISETPFTEENCSTNGTILFEETLPAESYRTLLYRSVELNSYQDKDVYIAWVHYDCSGLYCMYVTDIQIEGEDLSLNISAPQINISQPENLNRTSVDIKADVPDDGGASIIRKGFCYATSSSPTIDSYLETMDPHQDMSVTLTGLLPGETYFIRAFAVNKAGISYSEEVRITTPEVIVTTLLQEALTGEIPSDWVILDKDGDGYCWEYYEGYRTVCSDSYLSSIGALTPENYLFTPALHIPDEANSADISFEVAASAKNAYQERYKVVVSTQPVTLENCREADVLREYVELTAEYSQRNFVIQQIDISSYIGQTIYIGFVHGDCSDMESLLLKNVVVNAYE